MSIVYNNIMFDKVEDLVSYQKAIGTLSTETEEVVNQTENTLPEINEEITDPKNAHKHWSEEELANLKEFVATHKEKPILRKDVKEYAKKVDRTCGSVITALYRYENAKVTKELSKRRPWTHAETERLKEIVYKHGGYLTRKQFKKYTQEFNRTVTALQVRTSVLGILNKTAKPKKVKKGEYMLRKKPLPVIPQDIKLIKEANKSTKQFDVPEMPVVYPLTDDATPIFEKMLVNMIANKGTITKFEAESALQLVDGFEWNGKTWRLFCEQFFMNIPAIAKVLNIKNKELVVDRSTGYHTIKYAG
jgi:hypothetical protein